MNRRDVLKYISIALPVLPITKWMNFKPDATKDENLLFHFGLIEYEDKNILLANSANFVKHVVIRDYINNYAYQSKRRELKTLNKIFHIVADKHSVITKSDNQTVKAETFYTQGDYFMARTLDLKSKEIRESFEIRIPYSTWLESEAVNGAELLNYLFNRKKN